MRRKGPWTPIFNPDLKRGKINVGLTPPTAVCSPLFDEDFRGLAVLPAGWSGSNYDLDADGLFITDISGGFVELDPFVSPELAAMTIAVRVLDSQSGSQILDAMVWDGGGDIIEIIMSGEFASDAIFGSSLVSGTADSGVMSPGPTAPFEGIVICTWVSGGTPTTSLYVYDAAGAPLFDDVDAGGAFQPPFTPNLLTALIDDVGPFPFRLQRWAGWPCAKTQSEADAIALDWA